MPTRLPILAVIMVASLLSGPAVDAYDRYPLRTVPPVGSAYDHGKLRNVADGFFGTTGSVPPGGPSAAVEQLLVDSPGSNSLAMEDSEPPLVSISAVSEEVTEGQDAVFRLTRSGSRSDSLSVGLHVSGHQKMMTPETKSITRNSAEEGAVVDTTVTFEPGEGEAMLRLTTHDDNLNEGDGLLKVRIGRVASAPYQAGDPRAADVLVKDDDIPTVSIRMPELPTGMTLSKSGDTWEGSLNEGEGINFAIACTGDYEFSPQPDIMRTYFTWVQEMNHPAYFTDRHMELGLIGNNQAGYSQLFNCEDRASPDPLGTRRRFVGPDGGEVRIDIVPANAGFSQTLRDLKLRYHEAVEEAERLGIPLTAPGLFARVSDTFRFQCDDELRFCPRYEMGSPNSIRVRVINRDPVILIKAETEEVDEGQPARFVLERVWNEENLSDTAPGWADTRVLLSTEVSSAQLEDELPTEITFGLNETLKVVEVATGDGQSFAEDGSVTIEILPDTTGPDQNLAAKYTTAVNWLGHTPPGGRSDQATVTVEAGDEQVLLVGFGEASYAVVEGGTVEVVVSLSADPGREVVVPLSIEDQGGVSVADYSGVPGDVTFVSGETEQRFVFSATQDMFDDDGESVVLGFGALPTGVTTGMAGTSVVTITDDDEPVLLVGFGEASYAVVEGGTVEVVVSLSADPGREVVVPLSIEDQGGVSVADYSGVPGDVTFVSGETEQRFVFSATQDMFDDDGESVVLGFGALPTGVTVGTVGTSAVTITDDDQQGVVASPESVEVLEGESTSYMVVLTAQPTEAVTISVIDPANPDITAEPKSLTFTMDDWDDEQMVTVYALQDADPEDETGEVTHRVNEGNYGTIESPIVSVMVLDDDPDCRGTAFWCATVDFADRSATDWGYYDLFYHRNSEPPSSLTDPVFVYDGRVHTITNMHLAPGIPPGSDSPPTGIEMEWSTFFISILPGRWGQVPDTGVPASDYLDWTLHVGDVELPFRDSNGPTRSDGRRGLFAWDGPVVQGLFSEWPVPTTFEVRIEETPRSEQLADPPRPPGAPRYLGVAPVDGGDLRAMWWAPADDGGSSITGYRIEWKEAGDSWGDPDAVSGMPATPTGGHLDAAFIAGLTEGVDYTVRVIAANDLGSSVPSAEYPARPQARTPRVSSAVVDGAVLTLRFDKMLDEGSVPATDAFRVLVNGGLRGVESVAVQGDTVRLVLSVAVSGADEVLARYLPPIDLTDPDAIRDTDGNLAISLKTSRFEEVSNETDRATIRPLTARLVDPPDSHNGSDSFVFRVEFSDSVWVERGTPRADTIVVTGGTATSGWFLDRHTGRWEFTVQPDSGGDVTIVLPANRACGTTGAPCASGDRRLSNRLEFTVQGPDS